MAQGAQLRLRLFIEGVEVPVIAGTVASAPNAPATASIQIIPTDTAFFFKPRTVIHLFFFDYIGKPTVDPDDQYKLLFSGEVTGFSFMKEIANRFMVLQCEDFSNIWDYTHQYYFNLGSDNAALDGRLAQIGGQSQASFTDILSPLIILQDLVNEGARANNLPRSFPGLTGLLGGVIHLIESLTGTPRGDGEVDGTAVNPFFLTYNLRNRLTDQIFASVDDQTSAKLFELLAISDVISRDLGQAGYRLSLREIINTLLGYVYFSVVNNTTPKYVVDAGKAISKEHTDRAKAKKAVLEQQVKILKDIRVRLLEARSLRPPPKGAVPPEGEFSGPNVSLKKILSINEGGRRLLDTKDPLFIKDLELRDTVSTDSQLKRKDADGNPDPDEGLLDVLIRKLNTRAKEIPVSGAAPVEGARKDRLRSFIFRPDVYFLPPPKCNVLFPELYDQFSFSRSFLNEPSRLLVDTSYYLIDQNDPLLKSLKLRAVAPNTIPSITGDGEDPTDSLIGFDPEKQKTLILPHEQFTGIIMDRRTFPDIAIYFARSQLQKKGVGSGIPGGTISGLNVPYLRDASNFEFFKSRFQARSLNVAGRFNPFVVMGFPALIIDKLRAVREEVKGAQSLGTDDIKASKGLQTATSVSPTSPVTPTKIRVVTRDPKEEDPFQTGVHFLGLVARLQHSVNQQGGNTFIDISHAHLHNESTGFEREQDITPGKQGAAFTTASLEDFLFPPWFDEIYLPKNIGNYYREAFGSGSIMLRDRKVQFEGFADAPSEAETPLSVDTLVSSVNFGEQLEQTVENVKAEAFELRKKLHIVSNVHGSLSFNIFDTPQDKAITFRDSKLLGSTDVSFNSLIASTTDMAAKLKIIKKAIVTLLAGIKINEFILDLNKAEAIQKDSANRLKTLSKNVDQGLVDVAKIRIQEAFIEKQLVAVAKQKDGSKKASERAKLDPRKFKNDVRRSVEAIVTEYAQRVKAKQNVSEFVNAFIHRKIATLPQMLGIEDGVNAQGIPKREKGFFALAVGGKELPETAANVALLTSSVTKANVKDVLDPRPERFKLALKYKNEVSQGADDLLTGSATG